MRFRFYFLGTEILELEFAWPARGIYPVPDWFATEEDLEWTFGNSAVDGEEA